jgi:hypothetical protein
MESRDGEQEAARARWIDIEDGERGEVDEKAKSREEEMIGSQALAGANLVRPLRAPSARTWAFHSSTSASLRPYACCWLVVLTRLDGRHRRTGGAHGIGEIGITGLAAAIANAVFHATGKRITDLPNHTRQAAIASWT